MENSGESGGDLGERLCAALQDGDEILALDLLAKGADPNARLDGHGRLALGFAAERGFIEALGALLDAGARVGGTGGGGESALHWAARGGSRECARLLLEAGADPLSGDKEGMSPAHVAALWGNDGALREILSRGGSAKARDGIGRSPAHLACMQGREECLEALLESGADPDARDNRGRAPAHEAATCRREGGLGCLKALLEFGADPRAADGEEMTPAHRVAEMAGRAPVPRGHLLEMLDALLGAGWDPRQESDVGQRASGIARAREWPEGEARLRSAEEEADLAVEIGAAPARSAGKRL